MGREYTIKISESTNYKVKADNIEDALSSFEEEVGSAEEYLEEYGEFTVEVIPPKKS
jgi:hypothetical protein|tara:strand:- start:1333 stop:1503 length:171 start_codon:yes stop_codon:yes gene_type:complete